MQAELLELLIAPCGHLLQDKLFEEVTTVLEGAVVRLVPREDLFQLLYLANSIKIDFG